MRGELQHRIETSVDEETKRRLQRYCSERKMKQRDAIRRAVFMLLNRAGEPLDVDRSKPL